MKYGVSQDVYTIHYNDIQGKQNLPKYLKCDTSKKNQDIQKKIRELNLDLIERGYFLNEISLKDSSKKCIVNLGAKFSKILLLDSIDMNEFVVAQKLIKDTYQIEGHRFNIRFFVIFRSYQNDHFYQEK